MTFKRVAIIGTGLLGASLGLALKKNLLAEHVIGVARRQEPLDAAMAMGCFDEGLVGFDASTWQADLIVLCTPVRTIIQQFELLKEQLAVDHPVIITDVGSTKYSITESSVKYLNSPHQFIGSHPMAGGEKQGPETAHADLFQGRPVVITTDHADDIGLTQMKNFWEALGMTCLTMSAEEHDRAVAAISHAPHAAAVALVEMAGQMGGLEVASTGFASQTRLAEGHESLWTDIFLENRKEVAAATRVLAQKLLGMAEEIEQGDEKALDQRLKEAREIRVKWMEDMNRRSS